MPPAPEPLERVARDRLQALAVATVATSPGWVPDVPDRSDVPDVLDVPDVPDGPARVVDPEPTPDPEDVRDVVARIRAGALDNAAAQYESRYGRPLEHLSGAPPTARRWRLSPRLALVAALAVAVLGAGVVAHATVSAPSVPVATAPAPGGSLPAGSLPGDSSTGGTVAVDGAAAGATSATGAPGSTDGAAGVVVVHVVGQVDAPGVVRLPAGSRVGDAVAAAGGATPGAALDSINLAREVQDGEQIVVPAPGDVVPPPVGTAGSPGAGGTGGGTAGGRAGALVDLNSADLTALEALPGIGPVLAQRIIDWRTEHGRFTAVDELGEVAGIGSTLLGRLRVLVRV